MVAAGFSLRKWRNLKVAATSAFETLIGNRSTSRLQAGTEKAIRHGKMIISVASKIARHGYNG
jgi:hypothetical protein